MVGWFVGGGLLVGGLLVGWLVGDSLNPAIRLLFLTDCGDLTEMTAMLLVVVVGGGGAGDSDNGWWGT